MKKIYLLLLAMFFGVWSVSAQKTVSKTGWTVIDFDSEETVGDPGAAVNAIDGDPGTFWHTDWATTSDPYPHYITIDMGKSYDMIGFQYTPRNAAGTPDTVSFWTSVDNVTWDSVAGGGWFAPYGEVKTEAFTKSGQYIKFIGHSGQGTANFLACAELDILVLGADFTSDVTTVMRGGSVSFTDVSGNTPVAWEWIFEGGTPATSTDQNPTVNYGGAGNFDVTLISKPDAGDPTQNDTTIMENLITVDIPNISQSTWSIVYVDSELPARPVSNIIDGDPATFWHDNWADGNKPMYPHTIIIDLGGKFELEGFSYSPRPGGGNGTTKAYQLFVSTDLPSNTMDASWGTPVNQGEWAAPWDVTRNEFFAPLVGRYVIYHMLSDRNDNPSDASCSEINMKGSLFGAAYVANKTEIHQSQTISFTDLSIGAAAWNWTFEGGDPATSTEQNPVVKYSTADTFDVQLIMTPQSGVLNNDTLLKSNHIVVKPTPSVKSLARDGWNIVAFDSEEVPYDGFVTNAIDGDPETIWHTAWSLQNDPYPHYFIVDLGDNANMIGFEYSPRSGGGNGTVAQYELLTSIDAETYTLADSGTWTADWADTRTEMFEAPIATPPVTGRFVRFEAKSERAGNAWASCSEFNLLVAIEGAEFGSSATDIEKGGVVDYVDFSAGNPTGWLWTFEGGTPASSTEQSPSGIVYNTMGTYEVTLTTTGGTAAGTITKTDLVTVAYRIPAVGANYVYVDTVEFGSAYSNYTTDADGKYVHYSDKPIEVYRGESYQLKVGHFNPWGENDKRYQLVWIDWDNNGVLDTDEQVMATGIELGGLEPVTVMVPADAVLGEIRMRVVGRYHTPGDVGNAYDGFSDGEVEDYTLIIADLSTDVPVAEFSADAASVCEGGYVQFTDLSTGTPTSWSWTFEGGEPASSEMRNPMVTFPAGGPYDVSLTATQVSGSDDEAKADMITATANPVVSAGDDVSACAGADITLTGSGADTYEWDNGVVDATPFTAVAGTYAVTGTDANGCIATDTVEVTVEATIDYTVTEGTGNLTVDAAIGTFQWIDCSDNSNIAGATAAQFVPEVTGDYAVVVTVGDCSATSTCYNVEVVGIANDFARHISIYPNPSSGMINVAVDKENATIKVYNTLGALVLEREKSADIEQLEISGKGIYIIQIKSEKDVYTGKLVVE